MSPLKRIWPALPLLLGLAAAQTPKPAPVKTTVKTCGTYQIKRVENGFGEPTDSLSLISKGKTYATYRDEMVGMDACTDLTGDGVPEVILSQYSGGAHCCTVAQVYSLTTPPRKLLDVGLLDSAGFDVVQLDSGAKELVTGDWRFAYAYGLSFAESPAVTQIFGYRNGQYVDVTSEYPQVLLKGLEPDPDVENGEVLYIYATYVMAGQGQKAEAYLRQLAPRTRQWLENYAPDIRQNLLSVGMSDWPQRAGVSWKQTGWGIAGSLTRPGTREYLTTVREGKTSTLRLFQKQGDKVTMGPALLNFATPVQDSPNDFRPFLTVYRATGRDDAVVRDSLSGTVTYRAYRVGSGSLTELKNDPLGVSVALLGRLQDLASKRASLYRSSVTTDAQRQIIQGRIAAALAQAQPALDRLDRTKTALDPRKLGAFDVQTLEVSRENETAALVAGVVELGHIAPDQNSEYVDSQRYTFALFLDKKAGIWQVTRWQLTPRLGDLR